MDVNHMYIYKSHLTNMFNTPKPWFRWGNLHIFWTIIRTGLFFILGNGMKHWFPPGIMASVRKSQKFQAIFVSWKTWNTLQISRVFSIALPVFFTIIGIQTWDLCFKICGGWEGIVQSSFFVFIFPMKDMGRQAVRANWLSQTCLKPKVLLGSTSGIAAPKTLWTNNTRFPIT